PACASGFWKIRGRRRRRHRDHGVDGRRRLAGALYWQPDRSAPTRHVALRLTMSRQPLTHRLLLGLLVAVLLTGRATAQQDWQREWADTLAKAKGQPLTLTVHGIEGHEAVVREFQKRFPDIKVELTVSNPSIIAPRIVTEQRNGIFAWDSWWAATANMNNIVLPAGGLGRISDYLVFPEREGPPNGGAPDCA